jgi:hypothetical protein
LIEAAAMFSSRCFTEDVPGMGSITGERCRSHASESCAVVAPCFFAAASSGPPARASLPAATGNQGTPVQGERLAGPRPG